MYPSDELLFLEVGRAQCEVNGSKESPVFTFLKQKSPGKAHNIKWNFEKFLVSPSGIVEQRFGTMVGGVVSPPPDVQVCLAVASMFYCECVCM